VMLDGLLLREPDQVTVVAAAESGEMHA
jgi:hypothetical protein